MRTTLNMEDDLLIEAQRVSGLKEKAALVREGLKALIERPATGEARWQRVRGAAYPPLAARPRVILIDTSIWINHLRRNEARLVELLNA